MLDLDGTLVDSNYEHAFAWYRAFRRHEIVVPIWRVHRHIGMGGDQIVKAIAGEEVERDHGDSLRALQPDEFRQLRGECMPLDGAHDLLVELKHRGLIVVLASSSKEDDLEHFLDALDARNIVDGWTTSADVERTKPQPDVIHAALEKAGTQDAVMVGDSRWDIEAAANAGLETVCVITGGWSEQELRDHGATSVFESLVGLKERLDETPLGRA